MGKIISIVKHDEEDQFMIIKCKMCGGDLSFEEGSTVCECDYCGSKQTIPNADNEKKTNLFNRANRLRMNAQFDKASTIYEQIVAEYPQEAEAYWGLCLCAYGIEYVDDPATGEKKPTCHRTMPTSIMEDSNFEQACDYADTVARKVYRDEAKVIDLIQRDILSIVANEQPYDVFICFKETDEDGSRTEDSVLAQDIYDDLTAKGLKVFFSRITLEDKLGVQYEPYIYAALSSAKVMLAVGTQFEYYDAVWVKNEWSRFLGMMKTDKTKTLIPCFKGLDAYDMPKEFKGLQAQDMGKLGWMQDLVHGVEKLCGTLFQENIAQQTIQQAIVRETIRSKNDIDNLMKRVYLLLQDSDFVQADKYIGKVLNKNIEYGPAYVAKILVRYKLKDEASLSIIRKSLDGDADWKKALRFAEPEQKQIYEAYARTINGNEAYDKEQALIIAREKQYNDAIKSMNEQDYVNAIVNLAKLKKYKESEMYLNKCIDAYRKKLAAQAIANGNPDPRLQAAQNAIKEIEWRLSEAHFSLQSAEKNKSDAGKREKTVTQHILQLNSEMSKIHGLFSGGKKRNLESTIDVQKRELADLVQKKQEYDAVIQSSTIEIQNSENVLKNAKEKEARLADEIQKKEQANWTDEKVISTAKYAIGQYILFGRYPQTRSGNDATPIEWRILDHDGQKILLISRYLLDCQQYNANNTQAGWQDCTLRSWLNTNFLNKAFTPDEQLGIMTTIVSNSKNNLKATNSHIQDKVFLLDYPDTIKFLPADKDRQCTITEFAIGNRGSIDNRDGKEYGCWWLRNIDPVHYSDCIILTNGCFMPCSSLDKNYVYVRPVIWIDLDSSVPDFGL